MTDQTPPVAVSFAGRQVTFLMPDDNEHIHHQIRTQRKFYEEDLLQAVFHRALPGMAFVDVGANIGNHSLFYAKVIGAPVFAFEPEPVNFARLTANIEANGLQDRIKTFPIALGATDGRCRILSQDATNMGRSQVVADDAGTVELRRLDSVDLPGTIGFLKIDAEGFELDILRGAREVLVTQGPSLLVEAGDAQAFADTTNHLLPFGYRPTRRFCVTPTYLFERPRSQ